PGADEAKAANVRGMKLYHAKKYREAAAEFRAAIAADEGFVLAHYNLASMAALTGDKPTVLAQLRWLHASEDPAAKGALAKAPTDPDLQSVIQDPAVREVLGLPAAGAAGAASEADLAFVKLTPLGWTQDGRSFAYQGTIQEPLAGMPDEGA